MTVSSWEPSRPFVWRDGERRIHYGRGVAADADRIIADDFVLLSTARGRSLADGLVRRASAVHDVPGGHVEEVAARLRPAVRGGVLVALGGGHVIDVAKALAAAERPRRVVAIPTTLSGAEMTANHRMIPGIASRRHRVRPRTVIADPLLMADLPDRLQAGATMNALANALEVLPSRRANPVAVLAAAKSVELLCGGLPNRDLDRLALGGVLAGYAMGISGYGPHRILAQTVARAVLAPPPLVNAALLPHSLPLLRGLGLAEDDPSVVDAAVALAGGRVGLSGLRDLGVTMPMLDDLAADAAARPELRWLAWIPGGDDFRDVLAAAW